MKADIPEPPWRAPSRRTHPSLTRDAIVDAGIRVLDRDGLEGLSMRGVAAELGAGAASLYWHVRNKEALLGLIAERLTAEIDLPAPDPARWRAQLKDLGRQLRALFHRHRDSARITLGRVPLGPDLVRLNEWLFELLKPAGIPDRVIAYFGDLAALYVGAFAFEESLPPASPTGEDLPPEGVLAMFRGYLQSLPADRFPNVRRAADDILGGGADDRFEFGLDVILAGIAAYATGTAAAGDVRAAPPDASGRGRGPAWPAWRHPDADAEKRNGGAGREGHRL